jgi:hypothetical protein
MSPDKLIKMYIFVPEVQDHVLVQDPDLESAAVSVKKSHVTLDVFHISSNRQLRGNYKITWVSRRRKEGEIGSYIDPK